MSSNEHEGLAAIYDLAGGKPARVPLDQLADRLVTTLTMTKTIASLLRGRGLAIVTFDGVQLTPAGVHLAESVQEEV